LKRCSYAPVAVDPMKIKFQLWVETALGTATNLLSLADHRKPVVLHSVFRDEAGVDLEQGLDRRCAQPVVSNMVTAVSTWGTVSVTVLDCTP
jgi:hypothetical protein